jgi:hypothetical protein
MHRTRAAFDFRHMAACLAHQQDAGPDIPGVEIALPIGVEPARRDKRKIKRSGPVAPSMIVHGPDAP